MSRFTTKLQNQTAIILGGTGGVGMSITSALLEHGSNVIITSSRQQRLDTQLSVLRSQYPNIAPHALTGFTCDLASTNVEDSLATLVDQVRIYISNNLPSSPLTHFIYTAGDSLPTAAVSTITQAKFHSALQVRVTSCLLAVKHFVPLLAQARSSTVTLTGGSISEKPIPGGWAMLAFIASGLNGMTRQLASDLAPIRVNCVAPGVVDTDLWRGMSEAERLAFYRGMEKQLPTGKVASPDDVAECYLYFIRDQNVTGSVLHSNGGQFL